MACSDILFSRMHGVQEALDVWSLGVMAFELLTGDPALLMHEGKDKVRLCTVYDRSVITQRDGIFPQLCPTQVLLMSSQP